VNEGLAFYTVIIKIAHHSIFSYQYHDKLAINAVTSFDEGLK